MTTICPGSGRPSDLLPGERDRCPFCGGMVKVKLDGSLRSHPPLRPRKSWVDEFIHADDADSELGSGSAPLDLAREERIDGLMSKEYPPFWE